MNRTRRLSRLPTWGPEIAIGLLILSASAFAKDPTPITIHLAGDSTMAEKLAEKRPETGWGERLQELFAENRVRVRNHAKNGRSTKSFIEEGLWAGLVKELSAGDYVFIQFGHNDASKEKGSRYTPPEDYRKNLVRFVAETRAKKAFPVLLTSVVRRKFDDQGFLVDTHGAYPEIVRSVAAAHKVPLIDMQRKSEALLEKVGAEESTALFLWLGPDESPNYPNGAQDNTHFSPRGARVMAGLAADGIREAKLPLGGHLKISAPEPTQEPSQPTPTPAPEAAAVISKVWVADNRDGSYKNPILHADYSDPDVIRVGDDFYMVASSFDAVPGLPILRSHDLVSWSLAGHALARQVPADVYGKTQHGNGAWAPAIRAHGGELFIYYADADYGIYVVKTKTPAGPWSEPVLIKAAKGWIDPCPLWDDDGRAYLVSAMAASRTGIKSVLIVSRMSPDGMKLLDDGVLVFDGHDQNPTVEGPKFYKRNGTFYIFAPAGGVGTGWQLVLRSRNVYGPYESRVVMAQGKTLINGPHQGAWVETQSGESWFIHFQDKGVHGRVVHLQPMQWINDWPVIGVDRDGHGQGEPVLFHKKPNVGVGVGRDWPVATPADSDEFNQNHLGLQWQWQANPKPNWILPAGGLGFVRLFNVPLPDGSRNLWDVPNLLLQKFPGPEFTVTTKVTFNPRVDGEKTGLVVMGLDYATVSIEKTPRGLVVSQTICKNADQHGGERETTGVSVKGNTVYLRVRVRKDAVATFSASTDGSTFTPVGEPFAARPGKWIGAKVGIFATGRGATGESGYADFDWFRFE